VKRPPWEVADVIRRAGRRFIDRYQECLTWPQVKVLKAIERCRTAALGGHRDQCDRCGHQAISYNSCRNRHCPKCQTNARDKWLAARQQELLPADYYHLVFSVPHALVPLMWQNKKLLFKLLFETSAETLLEVAADPQHLGAQIGFLSVLHTWGQTLQPHPHVHCVATGGGLSPDHLRWIRSPNHFFLPVKVLSRVFRGKFVAGLRRAFRHNKLVFFGACRSLAHEKAFSAFLRTLFRQDWVVYAKRPFGGPEHVLHYLARYTHRVAISNHRLVELTDARVRRSAVLVVAEYAEDGPHLLQCLGTRPLDRLQRLARPLRALVQDVRGDAGLHVDDSDRVRDGVVHLASDPQPFRVDPGTRLLLAGPFGQFGPRDRLGRDDAS